mmetsp:Transcript_6754/g.16479  ORF Transcript_6754/g.16479 Transcript_6754/m.16479 type:complete len:83 (-) Transcript_6754:1254-1502(-)
MPCLRLIRPLVSARCPVSRGVAMKSIRNISNNHRNKTKLQNQWMHANYDRKRHTNVNRYTGGIFFVISTVAGGVSIYIMGRG